MQHNDHAHCHCKRAPIDGETLAFLVEKLRPSIRSSIRQLIGQKFVALDLCLIQIERQLLVCADSEARRATEAEVEVARALCDSIQKDLGRSELRDRSDAA